MAEIKIRKSRITDEDLKKILPQGLSIEGLRASFWGRECYVALEDGGVVGSCILDDESGSMAEIVNIDIDPKKRKKGIGIILLRYAIKTARGKGFKRILAKVANSSIGWLAFYQKEGFRIVDIQRDYFSYFLREGGKPTLENGIERRDMIRLALDLE